MAAIKVCNVNEYDIFYTIYNNYQEIMMDQYKESY